MRRLVMLAVIIPVGALSLMAAGPARASSPGAVTIQGYGDGHGVGMGQYGAFGYASEKAYRWTWKKIVGYYYGGTTVEPISSAVDRAPISVNLSELDTATSTKVRSHRPGAELQVNGGAPRSGTISVPHTGPAKTITATAGDVSVDVPQVGWRSYQGFIEIRPKGAPDGTAGQTWNVVPLEDYVAGVVPVEAVAAWGAEGGEAALRAQAVAARAYGLNYVTDVGRTCDITICQQYDGDPSTLPKLGSYATYTDEATTSTAGEVMCSRSVDPCPSADVVSTVYSASTGGWTAGGAFPLEVDAGDAVASNPFHPWTTSITLSTIERAFPSVGLLTGAPAGVTPLHVTARNGHGSYGGRAVTVVLTGSKGSVSLTGAEFAADLGLDSDWFLFATEP